MSDDRTAVRRHQLESLDRCPQFPGVDDDVDFLLPITAPSRERFAYDRQDCLSIKRGRRANRDAQLVFAWAWSKARILF
jgi:hypothetical protein